MAVSGRLAQLALGLAYAARPNRLLHPLGFAWLGIEKWLSAANGPFLRRPENALPVPDGLVDIGGAMSVERLCAAYAEGIYPWCHIPPVKWWSPSERAVLFIDESRIEKNLRRVLRQGRFRVTFDRAFREVMSGCAEPRPGRPPLTWISQQFIEAYTALHEAGHAHSVEVWDAEGRLAGGLYGVASGPVFFTESQFARQRDASKVAFVTLNCHLASWGYLLNDGKDMTSHLSGLGMKNIARDDFLSILREPGAASGPIGRWETDPSLDIASWKTSLS